jgi:hypothetical protein
MSAETPERPSRPERRKSSSSAASSVRPPLRTSQKTTAASICPVRVPIVRPSSGEKLIVVATERPAATAQSEAPLPRCATTSRPAASAGFAAPQRRDDRFVREAVEAVAAHARVVPCRGHGEAPVHLGLARVERGVEAGDLRDVGKGRARRAHAGEVVRLVQRRERLERRQRGEQRLVDRRRGDVRGAAVDDAVADAGDSRLRRRRARAAPSSRRDRSA